MSWVKLGREALADCLTAGVNDLGGTLMNESISRAAGTRHGQELPPAAMHEVIAGCGRAPRQRTTLYRAVEPQRQAAAWSPPPLARRRNDTRQHAHVSSP